MNLVRKKTKNKAVYSSLFTLALSLITTISILIATFQVTAWFKNFQTVETPAVITNFESKVEYAISSTDWKELPAGVFLPVVVEANGSAKLDATRLSGVTSVPDDLKIRITYYGKSAAYLRTSLKTMFQNADTDTYLPQLPVKYGNANTKWLESDGYLYYTEKLGSKHDGITPCDEFEDEFTLDTFTVSYDLTDVIISPHQEYKADLYVYVDAVQPDRYKAFWGLDSLPFNRQ